MSLLEEFIFALSKTEREKLRPLQFRGTKRKIFFKVLACRERSGIDSESILKVSKLTKQRYYQLLSEILDACYHDVAPQGGTELLRYLGNRQLCRHLYNEMRRQESTLLAKNNRTLLEQYYFNVLLISEFFMIPPNAGDKIINEFWDYVRRYVDVKQPHPHDNWLLRITEINHTIEQELLVSMDRSKMKLHVEELESIYEHIKEGDHMMAKFKVTHSLIVYYTQLVRDKTKADRYITCGKELMKEHPEAYSSISELFELDSELEFCRLFHIGFNMEHYKQYFHEKRLWGAGFSLNYMYRFFPLVLNAGDLALARSYIRKYFPFNIDLLRNETAAYYWELLMLYFISTENYAEARNCIQKAFMANVGSTRNFYFDIHLRLFDIYLAAICDDPITTENLVNRHSRYASAHGVKQNSFIDAVGNLMKVVGLNTTKAEKIREKFFQVNNDPKLKRLFESIYNKYFKKATTKYPEANDLRQLAA